MPLAARSLLAQYSCAHTYTPVYIASEDTSPCLNTQMTYSDRILAKPLKPSLKVAAIDALGTYR